jgi:hypothetical protein
MTTALQVMRELAKARGLTLSQVVDELRYEVHCANVATPECPSDSVEAIQAWGEIRCAASGLLGAFYDPKVHKVARPEHLTADTPS